MFFIPLAMLHTFGNVGVNSDTITWSVFLGNMAPVILGNIVGGSVLVGLVYHLVYNQERH